MDEMNSRTYVKEWQKTIRLSANTLRERMKSNKIVNLLRIKNEKRDEEERILKISNERERTTELLLALFNLDFNPIPQLKIALIKTGQSEVLQYLVQQKDETEEADILKSYYGRCFIHLQDDTYVSAKEFQGQMYIHIRNYENKDGQRKPTKQGVGLTLSRWLILESKREETDKLFRQSLDGKLDKDEWILHLGGGIQITVSSKFPTVDFRQFWKPDESEKALPTKKGISLNRFKWERLCDVMDLIREFVPEIDLAHMCLKTHTDQLELESCKECNPFDQPKDNEDPQYNVCGATPASVTKRNEDEIRYIQYITREKRKRKNVDVKPVKSEKKKIRKKTFKFNSGAIVRVSHLKKVFDKGYSENWTLEYFKIYKRFIRDNQDLYVLEDMSGEILAGSFYRYEIEKITIDDTNTYKIEKIIKKRRNKENRKEEVLVKWLGWPSKFNSWVPQREVKDI
ncbi:unnamed protein product [Mytilus coruscus]|uniref:Chromo domain-containing protein n=1 Tax=Mytilus coruscus TaxID=42192 RepID=A0A6J8EPT2_MYTCO|nr:unnamed protein product [Mytilus coruscus]